MNSPFASAMGRALEHTRAGDAAEATRIIQAALAGTGSQHVPPNTATPAPARKRQSLGTVIDSLVKRGSRHASGNTSPVHRPARPAVPDGARYLEQRHETSFGSRDFRLFVPSPRAEAVQGVVMMLHGCTQTADDFAAGTRMNEHAERRNLVVVYPQQDRSDNQMACWNWFRPGDQKSGSGEPALLADLARRVAADHGVSANRTFVAGLSAGGAMAAILGSAYPEVFNAVGVHSGLAPGSASDVASAFAAMRGQCAARPGTAPVRTIVLHGTADQTVHPDNAGHVLRAALGSSVTVLEDVPQPDSGTGTRGAKRVLHLGAEGQAIAESWLIEGAGHAWAGGAAAGSFTDPAGPDASAEMIRFFMETAVEAEQ